MVFDDHLAELETEYRSLNPVLANYWVLLRDRYEMLFSDDSDGEWVGRDTVSSLTVAEQFVAKLGAQMQWDSELERLHGLLDQSGCPWIPTLCQDALAFRCTGVHGSEFYCAVANSVELYMTSFLDASHRSLPLDESARRCASDPYSSLSFRNNNFHLQHVGFFGNSRTDLREAWSSILPAIMVSKKPVVTGIPQSLKEPLSQVIIAYANYFRV
jgi:hypothetical protein